MGLWGTCGKVCSQSPLGIEMARSMAGKYKSAICSDKHETFVCFSRNVLAENVSFDKRNTTS